MLLEPPAMGWAVGGTHIHPPKPPSSVCPWHHARASQHQAASSSPPPPNPNLAKLAPLAAVEAPSPFPAGELVGAAPPPPGQRPNRRGRPTTTHLTGPDELLQAAARCGRPQDGKLRPAALRHAWPPFPASLSKLPAAPSSASMASRHLHRLPPGGPLPLRGTQAKKLIGRPRIPSNGMAPRACRYSRPRRGGGALPPRTQLYELTGSHLASPIDTRRGVARERAAQRPGTWRCASASFLFRRVNYLPSLAGGRSSDAIPHRGGGHRTASQCATLSGISNTARALDRSPSTTAPHRRRGGACWLGFVRDRRRAARTQLDMGGGANSNWPAQLKGTRSPPTARVPGWAPSRQLPRLIVLTP
ncbi:hypothetical protein Purlil1_1651 [Purpureocillium lilacinum]|uniref:Uncharacterized protein n=1 Tax=Purpureocillium lilacinum TaxID=33203 RepID=A0ABR0CDE1_PURLI|nr:hypothetical protein Purlil1_1651 [Purpureocillium lilacinum]